MVARGGDRERDGIWVLVAGSEFLILEYVLHPGFFTTDCVSS